MPLSTSLMGPSRSKEIVAIFRSILKKKTIELLIETSNYFYDPQSLKTNELDSKLKGYYRLELEVSGA